MRSRAQLLSLRPLAAWRQPALVRIAKCLNRPIIEVAGLSGLIQLLVVLLAAVIVAAAAVGAVFAAIALLRRVLYT